MIFVNIAKKTINSHDGCIQYFAPPLPYMTDIPWKLCESHSLDLTYESHIDPFWKSQVETGQFSGVSETPICYAWCKPQNAHTAILLLNGRVETYLKYQELIFDLYRNGFAVFTMDHRGQGLSGRMLEDRALGYVEDFSNYVADIKTFVDTVIRTHWSESLSMLCHSMGGAIGTLFLLSHSEYLNKAALLSPMFGIRPAMPMWLSNALITAGLRLNKLRSRSAGYFFGQGSYKVFPFAVNPLTRCKERYQHFIRLYEQKPELQLGGVTSEWLFAAQKGMLDIEQYASKIKTPVLAISSGNDMIIDNKRQRRVVEKMPNATYVSIAGAQHELPTEIDEYRNKALSQAMTFLAEAQ